MFGLELQFRVCCDRLLFLFCSALFVFSPRACQHQRRMVNQKFSDSDYHVAKYLKSKGKSVTEICESLKFDGHVVRYWLRSGTSPSQNLQNRARRKLSKVSAQALRRRRNLVLKLLDFRVSHRRVTYTPKKKKEKVRVVKRQPFGSPLKIARQLACQYKIHVSQSTVRRDLVALGKKAFRKRRVPFLTPEQKANRVQFALAVLARRPKLLFSDEKWLTSNDGGSSWQWCDKPSDVEGRACEQGAPKICLWAVIGHGFKKLIIVKCPSLNAARYKSEVLAPALAELKKMSRRGWEFQQDNAPAHRENSVGWLNSRGVKTLKEKWPSGSPDMNVIEVVWAWIQYEVSVRGPYGLEDLEAMVREVWKGFSQQRIDELCDSFWDRCREVVKSKGETIKLEKRRQFKL